MKKLIAVLIVFVISLSALPVLSAAEARVFDFADILTDAQEARLQSKIDSLRREHNIDFVLLTSTEVRYSYDDREAGNLALDYAEAFYVQRNFGVGDSYNGVIIFIDMSNRLPTMSACGGTKTFLSPSRREGILEDMHNSLSSGDYAGAFDIALDGCDKYLDMGYLLIEPSELLLFAAISAVIALIWCLSIKRKYSLSGSTYSYDIASNTQVALTNSSDTFVNSYVTRTPRNTDSGGGGSGGGFSRSSGSSGRSFGGSSGRRF